MPQGSKFVQNGDNSSQNDYSDNKGTQNFGNKEQHTSSHNSNNIETIIGSNNVLKSRNVKKNSHKESKNSHDDDDYHEERKR